MDKKQTDSWVITLELSSPSLQDNTADADRLLNALKKRLDTDRVDCDLFLIKEIRQRIREWNYRVRCVVFCYQKKWVLAGICEAGKNRPVLGMAIDLGTSRVVIRLVDLQTGNTFGQIDFDNPQAALGVDVLARIHHCEKEKGLFELHNRIIEEINARAEKLCVSGDGEVSDIYLAAVSGNTTMTHLFLGLNPYWNIREPYIPAVNHPGLLDARNLDLRINPHGKVFVFPNVGSYFGGDVVSGILYSGMSRSETISLLVDVGTNAEVALGGEGWLIVCAGAAGPALEGGVTKMGMMAGPGVIDKAKIDPETRELKVHAIAEEPPVGICGSGLIDLAAQLFLAEMIDFKGRFIPAACADRLVVIDDVYHFVVVFAENSGTGMDLTISQIDLDSLIRSKAAMYTILETITATVGVDFETLGAFYVAGTFGSFIDPESAISIGMIPDLNRERFISLGNSSLEGATLVLQTPGHMDEIERIGQRITYLELNVNQEFMNRFSAAKCLPHTNPEKFPTVKTVQTNTAIRTQDTKNP